MSRRRTRRHDRDLPAAAQERYNERRTKLGRALDMVACDATLAVLCETVFRMTQGGHPEAEPVVKTYGWLGARPWRLCCGHSTARRVVDRAKRLGLLCVDERRYVSGGQSANEYRINWDGIDRILATNGVVAHHAGPGAQNEQGGAQNEQGGAQNEQGGAQNEHPYKEDILTLDDTLTWTLTNKDPPKQNTRRAPFSEDDLDALQWPTPLDNDTGRAAMREWLHYKRERGSRYKSTRGPQALLNQFRDVSADAFAAAVTHSIANNYQGVFAPSRGSSHARPARRVNPDERYDPADAHKDTGF